MLNMSRWRRYSGTFSFDKDTPIDQIFVEVVSDDAVVRNDNNEDVPLYITDIHFQAGDRMTGWVPETREFTRKVLHTSDETKNLYSDHDIIYGPQPQVYRNKEFREYNIAGRGIEVFTLPNWQPEEWNLDILPTGIDIEITPKDDYDFMRVCTNYGSPKEADYDGSGLYNDDPDHPLNIDYTREFSLGAGVKDQTIKILARSGKAYRGSSRLKLGGVHLVTLGDGKKLEIKPRRLFLAQKGAIRLRFEFYKLVNGVLTDTGIGYQGTARFNQWTYGRSRT